MSKVVSEADKAKIIDGKAIAGVIRKELKEEVQAIIEKEDGKKPGLCVFLVGARTDSATYVRMKKKACEEIGIENLGQDLPADITQDELIAKVQEANANPDIHGILVQLPLPAHINEEAVLECISPEKDVDGLHAANIAKLCNSRTHAGSFRNESEYYHIACTPQGCVDLIERSGVKIEGTHAVVIGRSNIVGIPAAMLLMQKNATVTIVHSRTKNPESIVSQADIVVVAVGRAEMVKSNWIKPGAIVIDVGINSKDDATKKAGYRLVGDVDYADCFDVAGKITPVPGGVGPMTIAMLMKNTVAAFRKTLA